jgi:hypothetical protein
MARANGHHNLHRLDKAIALYNAGSAGTRSGAEDAFLRLDLPELLVNTDLCGFEVDFHWPELKLASRSTGHTTADPTTATPTLARTARYWPPATRRSASPTTTSTNARGKY